MLAEVSVCFFLPGVFAIYRMMACYSAGVYVAPKDCVRGPEVHP